MAIHPLAVQHLARKVLLLIVLAVTVAAIVWWRSDGSEVKQTSGVNQTTTEIKTTPSQAGFNKEQHSVNDPNSIWVVVNKGQLLPSSYVPADLVVPNVSLNESFESDNMHLRQEPATALEKMTQAATTEGLELMLVSGYRSYGTQQSVYGGYVASQGKAYADTTSAQPGYSEHQTGLAADLGVQSGKCQLEACFGDMAEGKWLAVNAYKYGFIIRYQRDESALTGYAYEPWHMRYVGTDLAAEINKSSQTLEQFFGLAAYTDYPPRAYELKVGT